MALDAFGRSVDYLRISVTDRCNLRCVYCMPAQGMSWQDRSEILTFGEIERFTVAAAAEGISKVRLTGGEPLVRAGIVDLVRRLRRLNGIDSIAMTTNGTLLPRFAGSLAEAGLDGVNISLVSLDQGVYARATRGGRLTDALAGIDAAFGAGISTVKVNVVVMSSLDQDPMTIARLTLDRPIHVRFIEYMPIGGGPHCGGGDGDGAWTRAEHVPSDEILARLADRAEAEGIGPLVTLEADRAPAGWGPAQYYRFRGAAGTVGVISALSRPFCDQCNRLRLTADGKLRTCLFSDGELDIRHALRHGTDAGLHSAIRAALAAKPESHQMRIGTNRAMSQIGG
jgi:cyclic pyranopterin phosphate synthase